MVFLRQINSSPGKESRKFVSFQPEKTLFRQYCLPGNNFKLINFVIECFFFSSTKSTKGGGETLQYFSFKNKLTFLMQFCGLSGAK